MHLEDHRRAGASRKAWPRRSECPGVTGWRRPAPRGRAAASSRGSAAAATIPMCRGMAGDLERAAGAASMVSTAAAARNLGMPRGPSPVLVRPPDPPRASRGLAVLRASVRSVPRPRTDHRGTPQDLVFAPALPIVCRISARPSPHRMWRSNRRYVLPRSVQASSPCRHRRGRGGEHRWRGRWGRCRWRLGRTQSGEGMVSGDGCAAGMVRLEHAGQVGG
jgi:hypothetical protein